MDVRIVDFVAGARSATGIAVVIDVFRAFSVAAYAMARGASTIVPVAEVEAARALKTANPDWLLVGERHARRLPGFDCGNSPTEVAALPLKDRTIIHTTHAGTQGLVNASGADEVLTGALVNAGAIVRYLSAKSPRVVTLVRMGHEARERADEDDACAELLSARLQGGEPDTTLIPSRLRHAAGAHKFFDPACDWAPQTDFNLCTQVDAFDFVLSLDRSVSLPSLRRIDVPRAS